MRKIAIAQPYLFPYLGYFQLINAVDKFLIYDDVQYMQESWINRNRILVNGSPCFFNINLKKDSNFSLICNRCFSENLEYNLKKFFKTIELAYIKAPYFKECYEILRQSFEIDSRNIVDVIENSIGLICKYLEIDTDICRTSQLDDSGKNLKSEERVIYLNKKFSAQQYINPIGGVHLYSKNKFSDEGIILNFIKTNFVEYKQFNNEFVCGLSIIDIMMFNSKEEIKQMLMAYELI